MFRISAVIFLTVGCIASSCTSQTGPDANVEVFKTPEEAGAYRRQKLVSEWQELAARIANAERPDIRTGKVDTFALSSSADGVERRIDLTPLAESLSGNPGKERETIWGFVSKELQALDRDRLIRIGFERARPMIWPQLANGKHLSELGIPGRREGPVAAQVVINLYNVPVVRWPDGEGRTAIDSGVVSEWKVSEDQVIAAGLENLKRAFERNSDVFDTVDLPGMGRYGSLRSGADAAVVLLPEFLAKVRKTWGTADDVVLFLPSRMSVMFVEAKNTRLLDRMIPQWESLYTKVTDPLIPTLVVASDAGLKLSTYRPTTRPATAPGVKPAAQPGAPAPKPGGAIGPFGK
jgi:hypothetical protein